MLEAIVIMFIFLVLIPVFLVLVFASSTASVYHVSFKKHFRHWQVVDQGMIVYVVPPFFSKYRGSPVGVHWYGCEDDQCFAVAEEMAKRRICIKTSNLITRADKEAAILARVNEIPVWPSKEIAGWVGKENTDWYPTSGAHPYPHLKLVK